MIPPCSGPYATLPPGRHTATLDEVYETFVAKAPFRARRELIYRAVCLYVDLVLLDFPTARFWLDGGFVTHKPWAPPEDADVVVVVPPTDLAKSSQERLLPLNTMLQVASSQPNTQTDKLHPMGGLLDAFFAADVPAHLNVWDHRWSLVKDASGTLVTGEVKGYLEVGP